MVNLPLTGNEPEFEGIRREYEAVVPPALSLNFQPLRETVKTIADAQIHFEARAARLHAMINAAEQDQADFNRDRDHFLTSLASVEIQRRQNLEQINAELEELQKKQQDVQSAVDVLIAEFREKAASEGLRCTEPTDEAYESSVREAAAGHYDVAGYQNLTEHDPEPTKPEKVNFKKITFMDVLLGLVAGLFLAIAIGSRFGWLNLQDLRQFRIDPMIIVAGIVGCFTTLMAGWLIAGTTRALLLLPDSAKPRQRIMVYIFIGIAIIFWIAELSVEAGGLRLFGQELADLASLQYHTKRVVEQIWGYLILAFIAATPYLFLRANTAYHLCIPDIEYQKEKNAWDKRRQQRVDVWDKVCRVAVRFKQENKGVCEVGRLMAAIGRKTSELRNATAETARVTVIRDGLTQPVIAEPTLVQQLVNKSSALRQQLEEIYNSLKNPDQIQTIRTQDNFIGED